MKRLSPGAVFDAPIAPSVKNVMRLDLQPHLQNLTINHLKKFIGSP